MKKLIIYTAVALAAAAAQAADVPRETLSLDRAWRFHRGDVPYKKYMGHDALYTATKSASSKGPGRRDFNDADWRVVDLPHDYVVEGTPTQAEPYSQGSLPRDNAWYRRTFTLSEADRGKRIALHFEGVCTACTIHVNGMPMFRNHTSGVGFDVDITDIARYGEDVNVVAVYVDCSDFEGWYYEGGGIYRHVWLVKSGKVFVDLWGTFVRSEKLPGGAFRTRMSTEIKNISDDDRTVRVRSEIVDPDGRSVAVKVTEQKLKARSETVFEQEADVSDVKLWDLDTPVLYTLRTTVYADGEVTDTYETPFGYRTIEYTASDGFKLNGRRVFLVGYGSHQDSTGFGIGMPDSLSEFRMARLKSAGFNIFRTAHNPFAPAVYDACDRLGLMCMDENRWFNPSVETQDEVVRMIKRDRNHPSIIMWSLFNEEFYRDSYLGTNIFKTLAAIVHRLDPTRPATGADNVATAIPGMMDDIDLIGINHVYNNSALDKVRTNNPNKPIFFSEEGLSDDIREYCRTRPYIFGAIGFGGLPYRGETSFPYLFSGDDNRSTFTLLCDPTDTFWRERALWTEADSLKIAGHWTHPGREGKNVNVRVYTNRESVELFLNGKSLGRKNVDKKHALASFDVAYEPGELKAVGSSSGKDDISDALVTAGAPSKLVLKLENPGVRGNGRDTAIVSAQFVDAKGNVLPDAEDALVKFRVRKGGKFLAVGSPHRGDHASWKIPEVKLHKNKAEVYVEASADGDPIEIEAEAEGFAPAVIAVSKLPAKAIPEVPEEECRFLDKWLLSRTLVNQPWPDIDAMHRRPNFNFWTEHAVGRGNDENFTGLNINSASNSARLIHYIRVKVPAPSHPFTKATIHFETFEGRGRVYAYAGEKRFFTERTSFFKAPLDLDVTGVKPGEEVEVWAVLEANTPWSAINRPVRWVFE